MADNNGEMRDPLMTKQALNGDADYESMRGASCLNPGERIRLNPTVRFVVACGYARVPSCPHALTNARTRLTFDSWLPADMHVYPHALMLSLTHVLV
jgi:hypothetical protein